MTQNSIKGVYPAVGKSDESLILYRYRFYNDKNLDSLKNNYLWMSSPLDFNDPFETVKIINLQEKIEELGFSPEIEQNHQEAIEKSKILCLCKSSRNLLMWSYYADGLKGFVIGYDQHKLLESLASEAEDLKYQFHVKYEDDIPDVGSAISEFHHSHKACADAPYDIPDNDFDALRDSYNDKNLQLNEKLFATKNTAFQHEDEYRIAIRPKAARKGEHCPSCGQKANGDTKFFSPENKQTHAPDATREIIFGEKMPVEQINLILKAILDRTDIKLYQAKLKPDSFELDIIPYPIPEEKL